MTREEFMQARRFAFADIHRELALAKVSESPVGATGLAALGLPTGGGNFLAALGLLCYTEFGGKLKYNCKRRDGKDHASENFNKFFDELGVPYRDLRAAGHDIYDIFRCGLAHEYYVKKACEIVIVSPNANAGIVIGPNGRYIFIVEKYCEDLERQFDALEKALFP